MEIASSSSLISGLPVRDLLNKIDFKSQDRDIQIAISTICEASEDTFNARKNSHLTNATEMDHQIRFPLRNRVERNLKKLALACATELKNKNILKLSVALYRQDYLSHFIFTTLQDFGIQVSYTQNFTTNRLLTQTEISILHRLQTKIRDFSTINHYLRLRIYSGDYQTPLLILSEINEQDRQDLHHQLLGLCTNYFDQTNDSEVHFNRLLASNNILSKIKATYVLSMLYLRLHPKEKQNLSVAESFLTQGHHLIENNPLIEDYNFHSVFNRNGYALSLFRRGQVEEALQMLKAGIKKLDDSADGARHLHKSVLIYNAVQCLKALKRFQDCENLCEELLKIDSLFPEYWLELSVVYLEQNKYQAALQSINEAEKLDCFIPEIFALKGFLFLEQENLPQAIENYSKASKLAPQNLQFANDLQYCMEIS